METEFRLRETDDYIKLGQLLKATGMSDSGSQAKDEILSGNIKVNGQIETRRGKKLREGDTVSLRDNTVKIVS